MKEYYRPNPLFSLCGLNCALCPRYHTDGSSKCSGCGGKDFHLLHPSCAIINCSKQHDNVNYCCYCKDYPCKRYEDCGQQDSFITYRNVVSDFHRLSCIGEDAFILELNRKKEILTCLIEHHNDGRSKAFFCLAVNLLPLDALIDLMNKLESNEHTARELLAVTASSLGIDLNLKSKSK